MPRRTNDFQDLIGLIERQLAPEGARVTESAFLSDKTTGEEREVDIVIETRVGVHPFVIGVECVDQGRPMDSTSVEEIIGTHQDLPLHKTVIVSRSGFYKPAIKKANAHEVETFTLAEACAGDWTVIVNKLGHVTVMSVLLPYATNVTLVFEEENSTPPDFEPSDLPKCTLYTRTDTARGTPVEMTDQVLRHPKLIQAIEKHAFTDSGTGIKLEIRFESGTYLLHPSGSKHNVHSLQITAKCRKELSKIPLEHVSYGSAQVAHGKGKSFGRPVKITFVEQAGEQAKVGIRIDTNGNTEES